MRGLECLGQFGVRELSLISGKAHVLGDVPSRAPHYPISDTELNTFQTISPIVELPEGFNQNYFKDATFGTIY